MSLTFSETKVAVCGLSVAAESTVVVEGISHGLTEVPGWIQSTYIWDVVRLGHNSIQELTDSSFQWIRTKRLELNNNYLDSEKISDGVFGHDFFNQHLESLTLSDNDIQKVEYRYLHPLHNLRYLDISRNGLFIAGIDIQNMTSIDSLIVNENN